MISIHWGRHNSPRPCAIGWLDSQPLVGYLGGFAPPMSCLSSLTLDSEPESMSPLCDYPLRFQPLLRRYLWGGRRLETMLGKSLGPGEDYAESWEVVDHGEDQSVVINGPLSGMSLKDLVGTHGQQLFGEKVGYDQFPLLLKFLDCNRTLSVQVHPNDQQAAHLDPPDLGKTEAWVVLAADSGSKMYAGLRDGVSREDLRDALTDTGAPAGDQCYLAFEPIGHGT